MPMPLQSLASITERRLRAGDAARLEAELAAAEQARMQAALAAAEAAQTSARPISAHAFPTSAPGRHFNSTRRAARTPERIRGSAAFALHRAQP
jgi:hypothetical protein